MKIRIQLAFLLCCCWSCFAAADSKLVYIERFPLDAIKSIGFLDLPDAEFAPSIDKVIKIPFAIERSSRVTIDLLSADGDLVRRLLDDAELKAGPHEIEWDGKDDLGALVPDEVYTPYFSAKANGTEYIDNPVSYSGGEIIPNIEWQRTTSTSLSYELPDASRVLVRMGIKDGPLVRELRHWTPSVRGKIVDRWNGYDTNDVEYFADRDDVWVVVKAYQLPQYSVITTGNSALDYRAYRKQRAWPNAEPKLEKIQLQRDDVRLSQDFFLPREYLPRVSLDFEQTPTKNRIGMPEVKDSVRFKIDVPPEDKWILNSSFYETGLYVDYEFQLEEEQGFVPMIWEYDASDLEPGRHIATVQLFGFGGFISSSTVEFFKQ